MARTILSLMFGTSLLLACGGGSDDAAANSTKPPPASAATSVGSGTVEGTRGFAVVSATRTDAEPFREKARLEIVLSTDAACGRSGCTNFRQLFLRLSSPPGGTITPGVYSYIRDPDAGAAGSLEIRLEHGEKTATGCGSGGDPGEAGTVTLESVSATEAKGTFDIDVLDGNSTAHLTGRFDASKCP